MLTDELNPCFWPESRSLESLFDRQYQSISTFPLTFVQLFRLRASDVIAQSDPHRTQDS